MTTTASIDFETKIALVQIGVRRLNDTVFYAPSETERADHVVTVNPETGEADYCTCKWYAQGGWTRTLKDGSCHKCAHALAVERWIAEECAAQEALAPVAQEVETTYTVPVGYIRLPQGGVVRRDLQARTRERGAFSLYR